MTARPHPPALPHGSFKEVFPNVFFLTGTLAMPGPVPMRFSRNMTVIREGERLAVVNSVRLTEDGLRELDALGKVTDVLRIAGYHGMDDPFFKERYGAKIWAVKGQRYVSGFKLDAPHTYLTPDVELTESSELPISGAKLYVIPSTPPEGLLLLERQGGVLITGDCLQHWSRTDEYFSGFAKVMMRVMGFIKPHNVGPAWFKQAKPPRSAMQGILDLQFDHVLPAHGAAVNGGAKESFRPRLEAVIAKH